MRKAKCQNQELRFVRGDSTFIVKLFHKSDTLYQLQASIYWNNKRIQTSNYRLPYAVYRFQLGDIDNDGEVDIAVGVIKRTYFDPMSRKRPFFFKFYKGNIRPLWMGSRLSQPLDDFLIKKINNRNVLQSIEFEQNGKYLSAQYVWTGFGFRFEKYWGRNLRHEDAYKLLTR